jgi:hypothetical protein
MHGPVLFLDEAQMSILRRVRSCLLRWCYGRRPANDARIFEKDWRHVANTESRFPTQVPWRRIVFPLCRANEPPELLCRSVQIFDDRYASRVEAFRNGSDTNESGCKAQCAPILGRERVSGRAQFSLSDQVSDNFHVGSELCCSGGVCQTSWLINLGDGTGRHFSTSSTRN